MESRVWQQSPVLADVLNNGHRYQFHQVLHLLEELISDEFAESFDERVRVRPDISLGFPASDVRKVNQIGGQYFEVLARFSGLYGVDSPLPQYFLDDVTAGDESGQRLQSFLDVFNRRLYGLRHQVWKKQNPFTQLDEQGLYHRLVSGVTGQYWDAEQDSMAFGGSFIGSGRNVESLESILKEALMLDELEIDPEVVSWIQVEDGLQLNGQQALGLDTCLGDAIPMIGKKVDVNIGPVSSEASQSMKPSGDMGMKMTALLKSYLPEGVDFDVSIQLTPKLKQDWYLGSEESLLAVHTMLGEGTGQGVTFKLSSEQYLNHTL